MSQIRLKVSGMKCGGCVGSIEGALLALKGVEEASVSLEQGEVAVVYQDGAVTESDIKQAILNKGYLVG